MGKSKPWRMPESSDEVLRSVRSWPDFRKAIEALGGSDSSNKRKGDLFERLVQLLLQLDPEYECQLADVWRYGEIPESVKRQLNLPAKDRGVDLLVRTRRGQFWAVQAKYRSDPTGSVPYGELGTFGTLSAAVSSGICRGLICTTKREATSDFVGAKSFDFQQVVLETWETLPPEFWERMQEVTAGKRPTPLTPRAPRPYQADALKAARRHFVAGKARRGKLIMPCGTGKSLLGYWTAVDVLKATTVVVAVPSLILVRQTLADWAHEAVARKRPMDVLVVCSDKSTAEGDLHVADLAAPTTTDPKEIRSWLVNPPATADLRVIFVTYQSGKVLAQAAGRFEFDVGLFDEAHKTAGWKGKAYQHVLGEKNVRIKRRVFMTATERFYDGDHDEVVGMNDAKVYGERYHHMPFGEAIESGILADYTVALMAVTRSEAEGIRALIEERVYVQPDDDDEDIEAQSLEALTAEDLATAVALREALKQYGLSHAVSFHSRNNYAKDFLRVQEALSARSRTFGELDTYRVSSLLSAGRRHQELTGFRESKRALISNARCLTEGVDVPGIDLVLFAQPRQSKVDIVQAVGRALRKPPEQPNKRGYVLVPVLVEDDARDLETIVAGTGFENLIAVLKAMSTVDEDVRERIKIVVAKAARNGRKRATGDAEGEVKPALIDLVEFAEGLRLRAWDRLDGLLRPRLAEEQILKWADAHKKRKGDWPTRDSKAVLGAPGETWLGLDSALKKGSRGLPAPSSLAQLLARGRGVRNHMDLPALTEKQILGWADAHKRKTGGFPDRNSGAVLDAAGEDWANVDASLKGSLRGLTARSSLAKLLASERGVRNHLDLPPLTEKQILRWADAHKRKTGEWPKKDSGPVHAAPGETWANVSSALAQGQRCLTGERSLPQLLAQERGVPNIRALSDVTEGQILRWADAHKKKTGAWPTAKTGSVRDAPGETWRRINGALTLGHRGLPGGSSLPKLLARERSVRNPKGASLLTEAQILRWADGHKKRTGEFPGRASGAIHGATGEDWRFINAALNVGARGLPGGSSLPRLLARERGRRDRRNPPRLTEMQILDWADAHYKRTGEWPRTKTGSVIDAPGETWLAINATLSRGGRGLKGGSSLPSLLARKRKVRHRAGRPPKD